ncbi:MAG: dephospho-CoA kinase [Elusimicrobia bacterium RIFCSPLOWO2_01_FULL_64_13]|nr:MAG: dephospho-CoA kinase [Elusimicrobia bacterium RIFCSPHIGHO2_01_FULL_64_10]OGR96487.1 MAG: dephospho-CoA kinase [Elusimicrobia bacterium RIFCSPLOWO2_01_FULL_64_13]
MTGPGKFVVGLTGGIATGKSAVLREFRRLGAGTIDCDRLARDAVRPGKPAWLKIRRVFGGRAFSGRVLDRKAVARIVFRDPRKRKALERIIHPEVLREMRARISAAKGGVVVADIPLLFEAGWERFVDRTLLVRVPPAVQLDRLLRREGIGRGEARSILRAQWPMARKSRRADDRIDNSGPWAATRAQVRRIYRAYLTSQREVV